MPSHCRMRASDRDLIRGGHYGQRPRVPHFKGRTHGCTDQGCCIREESSCQPGAVHTWHLADKPTALVFVAYWTKADKSRFWLGTVCPLLTHRDTSLLDMLLQLFAIVVITANVWSGRCFTDFSIVTGRQTNCGKAQSVGAGMGKTLGHDALSGSVAVRIQSFSRA